MIKKTVILIIAFFWSYNLNSSETTWITKKDVEIGYSGTYHGIKCTKKKSACVDGGDQGKGIINLDFKLWPDREDDRMILYVNHSKKDNTVSIFFPDWNYYFLNMTLEGDTFSGKDDQSKKTSIKGDFLDEVITITLKRYEGSDNERIFYYKANLGLEDKELRLAIKTLAEKEKNIQKLNTEINNLNAEINDLKKTIADNDKQIKKLRSQITDLEIVLQETIKEKDEEVANLKDKHKKDIADLKSKHKNEIKKIKREGEDKADTIATALEKELAKPLAIDPSFIDMRSETNSECKLYKSPSEESLEIVTLKSGTQLENLVIVGEKDWSLVATGEDGLIGYLLTDCIRDFGGKEPGNGDDGGPSEKGISITSPKWDKGQKNKLITLNAPGFVSIKGRINIEAGILEVQLNDNFVDEIEPNGSFEAYYIIKSGNNDMTLKVIDRNNEIHELSFIIIAK